MIPLMPLARALRRRGDDVAMLVPASDLPFLAMEDSETLVAGADVPTIIDEVIRRTGKNVLTDGDQAAEIELFTTARIDLSADDALPLARQWRPDLVVHDPLCFLGPFLASSCGVPDAVLTYGPDVSAAFRRVSTERAAADYAARGVAWQAPRWVLDTCPPGLQVDGWQAPPGWVGLRPEAHRAPAAAPRSRPRPLTGDPRLLVTFGTIFNNPEVLSPVVRELSATGAGLRVALGRDRSPGDFAVDPDRVAFEEFVAYEALLEDIDAVVAHGGAGTSLGALAAGLPMVLVPQGADQGPQAERVAAAGAAIRITPEEFTPDAVVRAVADVVGQASYRAGARRIADQIRAMPSPGEVAAYLAAELA
jgi:hypothetical protein